MNQLQNFYRYKFSGLLAAIVIAIVAVFLSRHYGAPTMLFALLLGVAMNFLSENERCIEGVDMAAKNVLRIGVALLGLRISFDAVTGLGFGPALLVIGGVIATILFGLILSRSLKSENAFGCLTGGSVAICGASAAMALSAVLPQGPEQERNTIFTVITVTAFSTVAMVLYPVIASVLGMTEHETGIFLGATIHDVAQVVGAGYSVSDPAGDIATIIKLLRVAMLLPVVLCVMVVISKYAKQQGTSEGKLPVPLFVFGFVAMVTLNSTVQIPVEISGFFIDLSRWCIITAVAALGMKTSFGALVKVGWMPVAIILAETIFLAVLALVVILVFGL